MLYFVGVMISFSLLMRRHSERKTSQVLGTVLLTELEVRFLSELVGVPRRHFLISPGRSLLAQAQSFYRESCGAIPDQAAHLALSVRAWCVTGMNFYPLQSAKDA